MRRRVLFLTNKQNGAPGEDKLLANFLSKDFELIICHPLDCLPHLNTVTGVIVRNIWPTHEYSQEWEYVESVIRNSGIPTYNSLTGNGDDRGKEYLIQLYQHGFPVPPSVERTRDIDKLGKQTYYWIKPQDGCDGSGSARVTEQVVKQRHLIDYIIQPYVEFVSEPSFFFVDNKFTHAIIMPNRLADQNIEEYQPTAEDLAFAQLFVDWNTLPYGIQRIDAMREKGGGLLLSEVEDLCPYLYLGDVPHETRRRFLKEIKQSILKVI